MEETDEREAGSQTMIDTIIVSVNIYLTRAWTVLAQSVGDGPITTIGWSVCT